MSANSQDAVDQEVESRASHSADTYVAETPEREMPPPPPVQPGINQEEMLRQMAAALQRIAGIMPAPQPAPVPAPAPAPAVEERKPAIEKLRKYGAKEFSAKAGDDSAVAEYWLEGTIRTLNQLHCTDEEKVVCATSLLVEEAYTWWATVEQRVQPEGRTWEFFEREFKNRFITDAYLKAKKREFMYLKQNRMTVAEYEHEFTRLSKYSRGAIANEAERCEAFKEGLNNEIKVHVIVPNLPDFSTMVAKALEVELCQSNERDRRQRSKQKREQNQGGSGSYQSSRKRSRGGYSQGSSRGGPSQAISTASSVGSGRGQGRGYG